MNIPAALQANLSKRARVSPGKNGSTALLESVVRALIGSVITVGTLT